MRLLYRGLKKEDEFVIDYLARIATENGYRRNSTFRQDLRLIAEEYQSSTEISLSNQAKVTFALELCLSRKIQCDEYCGMVPASNFLSRQTPTVCESCYDTDPYIRFYWWFSAYKRCHIHGNYLNNTKQNTASHEQQVINKNLGMVLPELLKCSPKTHDYQKQTFNEFASCCCDLHILNTLKLFFCDNADVSEALTCLESYIQEASLLFEKIDIRLLKISKFLARYTGNYQFWLRLISLYIVEHLRDESTISLAHEIVNDYVRASVYFLSNDRALQHYIVEISDCLSTTETLSIPLENLQRSEIPFDIYFMQAYRNSLFKCKTLNYYKQYLGQGRCEIVFKAKEN
jgi:hypothetical protein